MWGVVAVVAEAVDQREQGVTSLCAQMWDRLATPIPRPHLPDTMCTGILHDGSTLCTDVGPPGVGAFQGRMCPTQLHWHFDDASTVCTDLRRNPPSKVASAQQNLH